MCSMCGKTPTSGNDALKKCAVCHQRTYCNKVCQRNDWKLKQGGHKGLCGKTTVLSLSQHVPSCVYAHRNPEVNENTLVELGNDS